MSAMESVNRLAHNRWVGPTLLLAALTLDAATAAGVRQPAATFTAVLMSVPFGFRRTHPVVPVVAVALAQLANVALGVSLENWSSPLLALFWAIFTIFARLAGRERWVTLGFLLACLFTGVVFDGGTLQRRLAVGDVFFLLALLGPAVFTGVFAQVRHRYTEAVVERSQALEGEREALVAAAVLEDRLRIARDMHDVVAHTVSLMSLNVGAVRRLLDEDQHRLKDILVQVEDAGRGAMTELQQVLAVLRDDGGSGSASQPRPRTSDVTALVDSARGAGQRVEFAVEGSPSELPADRADVAYRVVQEALTNARRHAPEKVVSLRLVYEVDQVHIEVVNAMPSGTSQPSAPSGGHGLVGMRERVMSCGGSVEAGPVQNDLFMVRVRIPYSAGVAA